MRKFSYFFLTPFLFFPAQAYAASPWDKCIAAGTRDVATLSCIPIVLQNLISFLAFFAGGVAVLLLLFAGFKFITSEGDPQKVANARRTMIFVLWGALIVVLSFAILMLISQFTGVSSLAPKPQ